MSDRLARSAACWVVPANPSSGQAAMAIATGVADVVVCYRAFNERSGQRFGRMQAGGVAAATSSGIDNGWHCPMGLAIPG